MTRSLQFASQTLLVLALVPSVTAGAADGGRLKWQVDAQGGRLTARRAEDKPDWQGDRLAEVVYWDAAGKERSQPLTQAAGWTFECRTDDRTSQVICRQADLGFSLRVCLSVAGDVLTVSVPAADIAETGPVRLKTLRLLPRFGAACEGNEDTWPSLSNRGHYAVFATSVRVSIGFRCIKASAPARCPCSV